MARSLRSIRYDSRWSAGYRSAFKTKLTLVSIVLLMFWSGMTRLTIAQESPDAKTVARELLGPLWEKQGVASTKAEEYVSGLPISQAQDTLVLHSYLLHRLHYSKFRDGLAIAEQLAERDAENPDVWMAKAWLEVVLQNPDRALVSIQKLNGLISKSDVIDEAHKRRFYSFLGRAIGFIQGPTGKTPHPDTLQQTVAEIEQKLEEPWRDVFEQQRQQLGDQVQSMITDRQQVELDFRQQAETARDNEMRTIEAANQAIDARRQQAQPELDRIQDEGRQRLQELSSQIMPLEQQANAINRSAGNAQIELQVIYQDIHVQQALLARERDPFLRALYANRIDQLFFSARNVEANLALLRNEYNAAYGQYLSLEDQRTRTRQDYNQQVDVLRQEINQMDRDQKRNLARLDKLIRGPLPSSTRARALDDKAQVFWVHYPFPVEARRQEILDSIK